MSSASATRHQRLDPLPFRIAQPVKLFPHHGLLDSEALNHTLALAGIPYWVRTLVRRLRADKGDAQHVGRARRAERDAGNDDDAAAGLGEAVLEGKPAGALHHVARVAGVLGDDGVDTPGDRELSAGRDVG